MSAAPARAVSRVRARVDGVVQGVGFRPYVYRLAREAGLGGFVRNDERGVVVEVEGEPGAVEAFLDRLPAEAPALARVERVDVSAVAPSGERGFAIAASTRAGDAVAPVAADAATCPDCLAELLDPADRRFRYPFVNCTSCGPRFTIVRGVPYDRPLTTMAGFEMCPRCRAEYEDPLDRRFHAEPNGCPECGPSVRLVAGRSSTAPDGDPLRMAAVALRAGAIVAVKGLGGYHLACLASDASAVSRLRRLKHREEKPFAVMARDLEAARALAELSAADEALLCGRERPIVLARRRAGARVAHEVAPASADLGVMLPYTPLHHLLLADAGAPLVMTSGNLSDEPIAHVDDDAIERLSGVADVLLVHDRPIHMRTDDSVVRSTARGPLVMRRARGWVPASVALPSDAAASRPVLACGAELKSTFCVAKGRRAWLSHHIGDLKTWETLRSFRAGVEHFERLFSVAPEVVAHDLHPDLLSTRYALERDGVAHVGVQHHHAHLAAVLAEHGVAGPAVGVIFDGTGYGTDGSAWGGEILVGDLVAFERAASLWPVRLPGGDRAAGEPWRMACAWLVAAGAAAEAPPGPLARAVDGERWQQVASLAESGLASPVTTSAGRLFDAIAALAGLAATVTYEGQAAMALEAAVDPGERGSYPLAVASGDGGALALDARETVVAAAHDAARGARAGTISARFHAALADAAVAVCARVARERGLETAAVSGGVFQNRVLLERVADGLEREGLRVLVPRTLPPNDGGVSYGQAAVAAARTAAG